MALFSQGKLYSKIACNVLQTLYLLSGSTLEAPPGGVHYVYTGTICTDTRALKTNVCDAGNFGPLDRLKACSGGGSENDISAGF